ncbi:MAG: M3 family metallopeptidase [Lachnospiraceae bacterium]
MLTDVDMSLGKVKGEDGKMVELTHGRYGSMLESPNRAVRKAAYERMMKAYGAYGSTFAATYAGNVKSDVFMAKAHGYQSAREAALYPDDIPVSTSTTTCSRPFTRRCPCCTPTAECAKGSLQHSYRPYVRPVRAHDQGFPDEADL